MIAIDTSALMAIVLREAEAESFAALVQAHGHVLIGMPTLFEFKMVALGKFISLVEEEVTAIVHEAPFEHVAFGDAHYLSAVRAFQRFGKGRHPASLNFGDCMAYAVAEVARCPLLFKGNDFSKTDIDRVI